MLIDSHAHLCDDVFDRDRDRLIKGLERDGIEYVIVSGGSLESSKKAAALARRYSNIYASVGVHPCGTDEMDYRTIEALKELAKGKKVIAIGECGLDYHYHDVPKDIQKKWFVEQIRLAKEIDLPVVVHDREANIDTYNILKGEADGSLKGVMHCYSGDAELARKYVDMGFYISIAGPVTYKSAQKLRDVAREVPMEYLLTETDSPCLTPAEAGRRRNEPLYVRYVVGMIAELRRIPFDRVAAKTSENAKRLFKIPYTL